MEKSEPPERVGLFKILMVLLLLAAAGFGGYFLNAWQHKREANMEAAFEANLLGIGFMDKFQYAEAVAAFEKVVKNAPDWLPGRINHGIATYNTNTRESPDQAIQIFRDVLKSDPNNIHAHFNLGILLAFKGDVDSARNHLEKVLRADPEDPDTLYELGKLESDDLEKKIAYFKKALEVSPYHMGAISNLAQLKGDDYLSLRNDLEKAYWFTLNKLVYSGVGKYALCIGSNGYRPAAKAVGPLPLFQKAKNWTIKLANGARWARAEDFGQGSVGDLYRAVRERFGAPMVVFDLNEDAKPDILIGGAVVEKGKVRDLLLRQEGEQTLLDVTREAGLADLPPSMSIYVGDYDNDGRPDLLLTAADGVRLLRNSKINDRLFVFEDQTAKLNAPKGVYLGTALVDLDQDGDLDLLLCHYADSPESALATMQGKGENTGKGLVVFQNIGIAKPDDQKEYRALTTAFRPWPETPNLLGKPAPCVNLAVTDIDVDRDLDVIVLADKLSPTVIVNDRLGRYHREEFPPDLVPAQNWNGALILDSQKNGWSDLLFLGPGQKPRFLLNSKGLPKDSLGKRFKLGLTNSPPLIQAQTVDLDLDGWTDVVGLSESRVPVLLHNHGDRLFAIPNALGADSAWPKDIQAVLVTDIDGDCYPDLLVFSEATGLEIRKNLGNGNSGLRLEIRGRRNEGGSSANGHILRVNNDAVGVKVHVFAGNLETGLELGTLSAGLGHSHDTLLLGIGRNSVANIVRLNWPDGTWQGEMSQSACQLNQIMQQNRMPVSCPLLFTWNGEKYEFICDFLGAGSMGEPTPDGGFRQPRAEESVFIPGSKLKMKDGKLTIKIGEPMDEATYLDRVQLIAIDHPTGITVYPDERFASKPPSQDLLALGDKIFPAKATDHRGRDVTVTLKEWDRNMVDGFARRSWLGYAEEHWVELDFADRLATLDSNGRLFLCLAGWTDYPYPESINAATQAGVPLIDPVLERKNADGKWEPIIPEVGFPAGGPRMMVVEVTGKLSGPSCLVRLRTNMQVFWDQIFVAPLMESLPAKSVAEAGRHEGKSVRTTTLAVRRADLTAGGYMQEFSPDGKAPNVYDFHKHQPTPVLRLDGMHTRFGDVTELLQDYDDRFVIFGAGDELTVEFDAAKLPPLEKGWTRSYVLRTWGYCKDRSLHTATGETIEPLPFRAMTRFPYGPDEHYPRTPLHQEYLRKYQTRRVGN